jgi:signal transduction histidine kinase
MEQATDRAQLLSAGAAPESLVTVVGDEVVVALFDADGGLLVGAGAAEPATLGRLGPGLHSITISVVEDDDNHRSDDGEGPTRFELEEIRAAVALADDGSKVLVGNEGEQLGNTIGNVRLILAVSEPIVAVLGCLILWQLIGRALRPVYRIRDDLERVVGPAGSSGRVHEPDTNDEVHELATTLNEVLSRLERQSEARRQFVADASHELKSPVANARALLETGGSTGRTLAELDRLQALVDDLLFLARTDETTSASPTVVDLDDLVFTEAERATIRTDVRIDASAVQPAQVMADGAQLARAIRNLLENAVRHAESTAAVGIDDGGDVWTIVVTDDGPGIPVADRERIFTRFARLESERSRGDGGTGLGLSIVEAIATGSGGTITVADHDGPGARLELALPKAL